MTKQSVSVSVGGSIVNELSDKIPSNLVAINELIKNAYDAFAENVNIDLDMKTKTLTITDDGSGMDIPDVDKLLHIANSDKIYGQFSNGRFTQGSKGLGFLSAFRFGESVTWTSVKEKNKICFTIDKKDITKETDLSHFAVTVDKSSTEENNGTEIKIAVSENNIQKLAEELEDNSITPKIINAFLPSSESQSTQIRVQVSVDGNLQVVHDVTDISNILKQAAIFEVKVKRTGRCYFYKPGTTSELFSLVLPHWTSEGFDCEMHLMMYSFARRKDGAKLRPDQIPDLFKAPVPGKQRGRLTPLLYINDNLFANYQLFNPEITRSIKTSESMPQMIGYVKIYSSSAELQFNSDRTNFAQTDLTDRITAFLNKANIDIQRNAAEKKKIYDTFLQGVTEIAIPAHGGMSEKQTAAKAILDEVDSSYRDDVKLEVNDDIARYTIYGEDYDIPFKSEEVKPNPEPGSSDNSGSQGNQKESSTGNTANNRLLIRSLFDPTKPIKFQYLKEPFNTLQSQINAVNRKSYNALIACSLRILFERATSEIRAFEAVKDGEISQLQAKIPNKKESEKVKSVITFITDADQSHLLTKLAEKVHGLDYLSIKNIFADADVFKRAVSRSNLGSHGADANLSDQDISEIAMKASYYVELVDVLLAVGK